MANTVFQLRRNSVSGTRPTTASIQPGELAVNLPDGILFSTNGSVVFEIGANNTTHNVTGNSYVVNVYSTGTINASAHTVGSIFIANTTQITFGANVKINSGISLIDSTGSQGTSGQVLTSNGSGNVYWSGSGSLTLNANNTDTQTYYIPMSNNQSGSWSNAVISTTELYFVPSSGTLSATIFASLSDISAKTNIVQITNALNTIKEISGYTYDLRDSGKKSSGVIAQWIETSLPHLVHTNIDGTKTVNYDGIIAYLIESIKELSEKVEKLESR
jgi:hypothetical protein